ncbi:MAG: hypothetical protein IJH64_07710 [Oscillospiraceae bacterium]|nr:hypothetical protein [Oscillospiraceae bacterium]MBR0451853.1 hypothetical protein [Oscillospiraceae bacterium]
MKKLTKKHLSSPFRVFYVENPVESVENYPLFTTLVEFSSIMPHYDIKSQQKSLLYFHKNQLKTAQKKDRISGPDYF